jgi:paraquat-inducible protein B
MLSILIGGIAFETDPNAPVMPPAPADTVFNLFADRAAAFEPAAQNPQTYRLIFNESVRGLTVGAPVEFRGIPVGVVSDVRAQIDLKTFQFSVPVTIRLDPRQLGVKVVGTTSTVDLETMRERLINSLVAHGIRAQLRSGNLLTGAVYVALDIFPNSPPATIDWSRKPVQLPTVPGQLEQTEASINNIIKKLDKMPLQQIGENLNKTLSDLDLTLVSARGTLDAARITLGNTSELTGPNSSQIQQLDSTLQEVSNAARSIRVLSDYLERHPESLIRGKKGEAK